MRDFADYDPIDRILDRRLPGLSGERRALARERLAAVVQILIRMAVRQVREAQARDSEESDAEYKMDSPPPPP